MRVLWDQKNWNNPMLPIDLYSKKCFPISSPTVPIFLNMLFYQ
jgi:hypothetical protein